MSSSSSSAPDVVNERCQASNGWGVLHLFCRVDSRRTDEPGAAKRVLDAVASFTADGRTRRSASRCSGHKADLGVMAFGPDLARLQAFQHELSADRWSALVVRLAHRGLGVHHHRGRRAGPARRGGGLTDPAEVEARLAPWRERIAHYREHRLHPRLPRSSRSASTRCRSGGRATTTGTRSTSTLASS